MSTTDVRPGVALFGFGRIGKIHFGNLRQHLHELDILYIVDDASGAAWEAKVGFYSSF